MPFEPLRFLHAANIRLDQPIGETYPLPSRVASIVQDATRAAFERLIGVAIERRVDFLLLTGNTFNEADRSLAARLAVVDGFEQLAQESIRVFVVPGPLDPIEAWQQIPDLPDNTTILDGSLTKPLAFKRDDKTIARIGVLPRVTRRKGAKSPQRELRSESLRPHAYSIGALATNTDSDDAHLLDIWSAGQEGNFLSIPENEISAEVSNEESVDSPVDYLAFGAGRARRTFAKRKGIAHDSGSTQGAHPRETGPRGATLVSVDADGTSLCDFIPTASVRWERFTIRLDASLSRHELLERCRSQMAEKRGDASENAWIVEWVLVGNAGMLEPFDSAACRQFGQELNETSLLPGTEAVVHNVVLHADAETPLVRPVDDPLRSDFCEALAACHGDIAAALSKPLADLSSTDPEWAAHLQSLAAEAEIAAVHAHAQRFGWNVLRTSAGEGVSA
jgi:DNA repair protein SbcD/Mre11